MRHKKILSHAPDFRNAIIFPIEEKRGRGARSGIASPLGINNGKSRLRRTAFLGNERSKRKKSPAPCDFFRTAHDIKKARKLCASPLFMLSHFLNFKVTISKFERGIVTEPLTSSRGEISFSIRSQRNAELYSFGTVTVTRSRLSCAS